MFHRWLIVAIGKIIHCYWCCLVLPVRNDCLLNASITPFIHSNVVQAKICSHILVHIRHNKLTVSGMLSMSTDVTRYLWIKPINTDGMEFNFSSIFIGGSINILRWIGCWLLLWEPRQMIVSNEFKRREISKWRNRKRSSKRIFDMTTQYNEYKRTQPPTSNVNSYVNPPLLFIDRCMEWNNGSGIQISNNQYLIRSNNCFSNVNKKVRWSILCTMCMWVHRRTIRIVTSQ